MQSYINLFKEQTIRRFVFVWVMSWLLIAGGTIYVLPVFGADQLHNVPVTFCYFIFFAIIGVKYFGLFNTFDPHKNFRAQLLLICLFTLIQFSICLGFDHLFPLAGAVESRIIQSKFFFPLFKPETLIAKFADISFQQVFIFGMIRKLKQMGRTDKEATFLFSLVFFGVHLPLVFSLRLYAFYFIIPSSLAGVFFALAILKNRRGFALSVFIHEFFYVVLGILLRLS